MLSVNRTPYVGSTGPLWRVRLTRASPTELFSERKIPHEFVHEQKILFGFHHSITDGFSSTKICGVFMNFLNDVLTGKSLDCSAPSMTLSDPELCLSDAMKEVQENWEKHPEEKQKTFAFLATDNTEILVLKAFPVDGTNVEPCTFSIRYDFDHATSKCFLEKCKSNGITCHAGFFTATQLALIEVMQEAKIEEEEFDMITRHAINGRRYWSKDVNQNTEFCAAVLIVPICFAIKPNQKNGFWKIANDFGKLFNDSMNNLMPLKNALFMVEVMKKLDMSSEKKGVPKVPNGYYDTTNMGDITSSLTGDFARVVKGNVVAEEAKQVIVTDFHRSTSTHFGTNICSLVLHSLKGRLLFSIDFNVTYMTKETAVKYRNAVVNMVKKLAKN